MLSTENFTPSRINITAVHVDIAAEIIKSKKKNVHVYKVEIVGLLLHVRVNISRQRLPRQAFLTPSYCVYGGVEKLLDHLKMDTDRWAKSEASI